MKKQSLALILFGLLACVSPAHASVVLLSGGDLGEGLTLIPANVVAARHVRDLNPTLQGVAFPTNSGLIIFSASGGGFLYPTAYVANSNTSNDLALNSLMNTAIFGNASNLIVTVSGLNAGQSYVTNLLLTEYAGPGAGQRDLNFSYNGGTAIDAFRTGSAPLGYNVQNNAVANNFGIITIAINSPGEYIDNVFTTGNFPVLSAVIVSSVPEPSSFALLAIGGVFTAFIRGRRGRK